MIQKYPIRILGITAQTTRLENGRVVGKHGQLFNRLAERLDLVGLESSALPKRSTYHHKLLTIRRNRQEWYTASRMNVVAFEDRSRRAQRLVEKWEGQYDMIFQLHTMFSIGRTPEDYPYVLATDNTYRISEKYWPQWVPVKWGRDAWIRRETQVYKNAAAIFTWSEFARQSMIQDYGIHAEKIIATGVGSNFIEPDISLKKYDIRTALFVGYEFERKGGEALLKAWEIVHQQMPDAQLYIVGPPKPETDLPGGVQWFGRVEDRAELRSLYNQASVFVMPSLFEPWGLVFAEAMGMGLPCIGVEIGATPEVIIDGETGFLVPSNEAKPIADTLIRLFENPRLAQQLGHQAHAMVGQKYSWDHIADIMAQRIAQVAQSKG